MRKHGLIIVLLLTIQMAFGQLTGTKSIPGDYATIEAAIAALNSQGVGSGGVTFNVAAGHTETFTTPNAGLITATGTAADQIIFQKSGGGANPLITAANPGAGTMDFVICLSGADYVTFDGIDIQENPLNSTSTELMEWAYAILKNSEVDGSQHNTIRNCSISLSSDNTSSRAIYSNNHTTSSTSQLVVTDIAGTNSYNKYYGLTVSNCYHAFYIYGRADASPYDFYDQGNQLGVDGANTVNGLGGSSTSSYGLYCYYQNGIQIANNTFTGTSNNTSGSQYVMYISTSYRANVDIYNNTVSMTSMGTGSFYALYCSAGSSGIDNSVNVHDNSIVNNAVPNHTSGTVYLFYVTTGAVSANCYGNNVSNNTIGSPSTTSTGSIYFTYFSSSPSVAGVTNVHDNNVSDNARIQSTTGSGSNYLFYTPGSAGGSEGVLNVYDNTVNNITTSSSGTTYGFYNSNSAGTKNIHDNTISNIINANNTVYSFYNSSGTNGYYYNNKVQNVNMNSTSGTLYGFYISSGTSIYLYNNYISELYAPNATGSTAIRGITFNGGTSHGAYNNTIYLDASSSGSGFGTAGLYASTTPIVELRNNIIVNVSVPGATGMTVAYYRSSTTLSSYATTSNDNDFYAGTPGPSNVILYDGTDAYETLEDYQALVSPADATSVTADPPFMNKLTHPYDLHMKTNMATQMESGGGIIDTPIAVIDDYDGDARYPNPGYPENGSYPASAPDIGADEFGGIPQDLTSPNIVFTPLPNTSSTTDRTIVASITDASGVPTAGIGLPVLYWKLNDGAYTGVTAVWLGADQYSFTFGSGVVLGDVVSYYVVAQDEVTPNPNVGVIPSGGASGLTADPPACAVPPDPPYSYTILPAMCGTFQVGAGQTYTTITEALADVAVHEVTCPVVLELTDALYDAETLPIQVMPFAGGSDINTVTIRPAAGITPTITGSGTAIFQFDMARYYIIDGSNIPGGNNRDLTIENASTSSSTAAIWFTSEGNEMGSMYNMVKNCNIMAGSNTVTTTFGIYIGGTSISTSGTGADNDANIIENNHISRAYYGIYANGVPSVGEVDNMVIKDNQIGGDVDTDYITGYGMRLQSIHNAAIMGNEIYNMIRDGSRYGMYMSSYVSNCLFQGNYIHAMGQNNTTSSYYCIAMYFASSTGAVDNQISDNLIFDLYNYGSTSNYYGPIGFRIIGGSNYRIWHNSVYLTGAFGSSTSGVYSHCLFISTATSDMDLRDNIFVNTMTGNNPNNYTVYTVNTTTFSPINYNDYYATGAFGYYGAEVADFAAWQIAVGQDANSMNVDPGFVSPTDLHPTNMVLDNLGIYIPAVPKDFDGVNRTDPPDMGAYEFGTNPVVMTMDATGVDCAGGTLNGMINANGLTVNSYFDYGPDTDYGSTIDGNPDIITGNTDTPVTAILSMPPGTTYHYRLRGVTSGGVTAYGDDMIIMSDPTGPPPATTLSATNIGQFSATLNGLVNALCNSTTVTFEYGETTSYGSTATADQSPVTGSEDTPVSADIAGLGENVLYHFRVKAESSEGITYGDDMTFTSGANPPVVTTMAASNIGNFSATLNGTVNAMNQSTTVTFEWGLTDTYGYSMSGTPGTVEGNTPQAVYADISGLDYNTTYHFRCVGQNSAGTTYGDDMTFMTLCPEPEPAGTITGSTTVCQESSGHIYWINLVQYATDYEWTVPAGATITDGQGTTQITVSYGPAAVSGDVSVYGMNECGSGMPSTLAVTVNPLPVPTIDGPDMACINSTYTYTTESGMNNYEWAVSAGGQIMGGLYSNSITVKWNNTGDQFVSVSYNSAAGCPAAEPTVMDVSVGGLPSPTIVGSDIVCVNDGIHVYTTEGGYYNYVWTVSSGGTIVSGQGTYQAEITWQSSGNQTVTVNYETAFGCSAPNPASFAVDVMGLPDDAGDITGTDEVCEGTMSVNYTVAPIEDALYYMWSVPAGATIVDGDSTASITVDYAMGAGSGQITVYGENLCGDGMPSSLDVTVNPIPPTPVATVDEFFVLHSDAPEGNQWYLDGNMIDGATGQDYQAEMEGMYWTIVTINGCVSEESNHVEVIFVGVNEIGGTSFSIYPIPNDGRFTATIDSKEMQTFSILVYNDLGVKIYEKDNLEVNGRLQQVVDLNNPAKGIYTVVFRGDSKSVTRKVLVTK